MNDVVTAAPRDRTILVTGFGAFPGAPRNPTAMILAHLARRRGRLARLGVTLRCERLPVVYAEIDDALRAAVAAHRPDAILHLGLAGRRRRISVEARAINRAGPLHPDARRQRPAGQILVPQGPSSLRATTPTARILAALRQERHDATASNDAGDYVCNATLYRTLLAGHAPLVGFLHVPNVRKTQSRCSRSRMTIEDLTDATFAALLVIARQTTPFVSACVSKARSDDDPPDAR